MKKLVSIVLLFLLSLSAHAGAFPQLITYVVNGAAVGSQLTSQAMTNLLGKPSRTKAVNNECAETVDTYYYYPSVTIKSPGYISELFFNNPKNQIRFATMKVDASTTTESIKKLAPTGQLFITTEKGITTYKIEDANDPSAWIFDFKGTHLYRASFFSDDC